MRELVVGRCRLEHNLVLARLPVYIRVLLLEEDQFIICWPDQETVLTMGCQWVQLVGSN